MHKNQRAFLAFGLLLLVCSCCTSRIITQNDYESTPMNMPIKEFIAMYGQPYKICEKESGVFEYTYMQKVDVGQGDVIQTNYVFTVMNGYICNKRQDTLGKAPILRFRE